MVKTPSLQHFAFLAEASSVMSSSLDCQSHLPLIAELAVAYLSEWCLIDLVDCESHFNQLVVAHREPDKKTKVELRKRRSPICLDSHQGLSKMVKLRSSQVIAGEKEEILNKISLQEEPFEFPTNLKSAAVIPLIADTEILGAITFLSSRKSIFSDVELSVAEDFAKRISRAIENGRFYEKAIKANKSKSVFLANMSHEIRTPLAAMLGFADLLSEAEGLKKEHLASLETITRNGKQLLKIVNEILDLSKVESDLMNIEEVDFSIDDLVRDLSSLFSLQAQRKGFDFKIVKKDEASIPDTAISDPARIRQILVNVIGNAFKFTESGEVILEISCEEVNQELVTF
ncbi:MAG: histidine kinase dimerization/phospho-acceptor domain-containing protein, partial [Pseudobdellovibrionaceae bacterium]